MSDAELKAIQEQTRQAKAETEATIDAYIVALKAQIRNEAKAEQARLESAVDEQWKKIEQQGEFYEQIERPANKLVREFRIPGLWAKIPKENQEERIQKIADLREKAETGDKLSQAILLRAQTILAENKISTAGLPSLDWKPPEPPAQK